MKSPTTGLCVTGCPYRQRIDYRELLSYTDVQLAVMRPRRTKMSRKEAHAKCTETKITGFYLDSCLFDLLTTGNVNFSAAAWHALDDSFLLDEIGTLRDLQTYNTTEPRLDNPTWPTKRPMSCSRKLSHSFSVPAALLLAMFFLARWQYSPLELTEMRANANFKVIYVLYLRFLSACQEIRSLSEIIFNLSESTCSY